MENELNGFKRHLLVYRGLNECTICGYVSALKRFLKGYSNDKELHQRIEDCIADLRMKGYSYNHVVNTSLALERYSEFKDQPIKVGRPKKPRPLLKEVLSESEIVRIIHSTKNVREKAIVALLAYSGIRNLELCKLRVSDIRLGENVIRVTSGKGSKDRSCFISGECAQLLIEYLTLHSRRLDEYLFTTLVKKNRLATGDVRKILKSAAKRARIAKRVYPHLLRHSLATNMLNRGANLMAIKNQLGHVYIETTLVYLNYCLVRNRFEYQMFAPNYL